MEVGGRCGGDKGVVCVREFGGGCFWFAARTGYGIECLG